MGAPAGLRVRFLDAKTVLDYVQLEHSERLFRALALRQSGRLRSSLNQLP